MAELAAAVDDLARRLSWLYGAATPYTQLTAQERDVLHPLEKRLYRLIVPNLLKLPPKLYHYTDERGIDGMLSSRGIRATYWRDLVDQHEIRWGITAVNEAMQFFRGKLQDPQLRELMGVLYYAFVEHELRQEYYIACFTESGDSDRHWTEYGCADSGFAIEFDSFALQRPSAVTYLDLQPVIYTVKEQMNLISEIVLACWASTLDLVRSTSSERHWLWLPHIMGLLTSHLHFHLSLMKREDFVWEKEWRVIVRADKPIEPETGIKRFWHIPLLTTTDMSPIRAITARPMALVDALRQLIRSHGYVAPQLRPE